MTADWKSWMVYVFYAIIGSAWDIFKYYLKGGWWYNILCYWYGVPKNESHFHPTGNHSFISITTDFEHGISDLTKAAFLVYDRSKSSSTLWCTIVNGLCSLC